MNTFRVKLSATFTHNNKKPTFPSYDWSDLKADKIEIKQMAPGNTLNQNQIEDYDTIVLMSKKVTTITFSPIKTTTS